MKCVVCHGSEIHSKDVQEGLAMGEDLVHVPIRIPVCHTCGERYYDRRTLQYLEETERKLRNGDAELRQTGRLLKIR